MIAPSPGVCVVAAVVALSLSLLSPPALAAESAGALEINLRVIYAHKKATAIDPKLKDLAESLGKLGYTAFELRDQTTLKLAIDGKDVTYAMPKQLTLRVAALERKKGERNQDQVHLQLAIPELKKFKTLAWIGSGATLVIGGPSFEDGVLLFAIGASAIK